jgi:mannosyltransferase OCH1-like enzyme
MEAKRARPWAELNLQHRYELLSDTNEEGYINSAYGPEGLNRMDIIEWLRTVKDRIVRADVLRYLIMYAEGGVYADIDVEALQPIAKWVPEHYNINDVEMVVGIEVDQPDFAKHPILGKKSMTFCQWTFMSKPKHPVMLKLVEHIRVWLAEVAKERGTDVEHVKLDFTDIISGTGPSAFANAILEYMSEKVGHQVTWDSFHNQVESKLVGGILVLPVEAFAAGQGHSDSGSHSTRRAFVKHHYHASKWPDSHPMLNHEMYGRVEDCNWRKDCVSKWDENVEAWKKLSKSEQAEMLEEKKQKEIKEKEEKAKADAEREAKEAQEKKEKAAKEAAEAKEKEIAVKGGTATKTKGATVKTKDEGTKSKEEVSKNAS